MYTQNFVLGDHHALRTHGYNVSPLHHTIIHPLVPQQCMMTSCLCENLISDMPAFFNNRYREQIERQLMKIITLMIKFGI